MRSKHSHWESMHLAAITEAITRERTSSHVQFVSKIRSLRLLTLVER